LIPAGTNLFVLNNQREQISGLGKTTPLSPAVPVSVVSEIYVSCKCVLVCTWADILVCGGAFGVFCWSCSEKILLLLVIPWDDLLPLGLSFFI